MRTIYKCDILASLKNAGFTTYSLRQNRLLSENVIQHIRKKEYVAPRNIAKIAIMLRCRPEDLVEYVQDQSDYNWIVQRVNTPVEQ